MEYEIITEKQCTICGVVKGLDFYHNRGDKKHLYRSQCKECFRVLAVKGWKNVERGKFVKLSKPTRPQETGSARIKRYRSSKKNWAIDLLGGKCIDCGNSDRRVLHFDHLDPSTKIMNISQITCRSKSFIEIEVRKCVLRCANCHTIKTWYSDSRIDNGELCHASQITAG